MLGIPSTNGVPSVDRSPPKRYTVATQETFEEILSDKPDCIASSSSRVKRSTTFPSYSQTRLSGVVRRTTSTRLHNIVRRMLKRTPRQDGDYKESEKADSSDGVAKEG